MDKNGRLEQMRKAKDTELVRRNLASDQQDWVPGLTWPEHRTDASSKPSGESAEDDE